MKISFEFITISEAKDLLGCSREHLYHLEQRGVIRFYQMGDSRRTYLKIEELNEAMVLKKSKINSRYE